MRPVQVFIFFWSLLVLLGITSIVFPGDGIAITDNYTLSLPSIPEIFEIDTVTRKDYTAILENDFDIDSLEIRENHIKDSIRAVMMADSIRRWQLKLHYPENNKSVLYPLFTRLDKAADEKPLRIMHYGDSQIEADRISGYLRFKLQGKFGGSGPGLMPAVPLVRSAAFNYEGSENWKRYTFYGLLDSTVTHNDYGPLATFGRYTEILPDSLLHDTGVLDSLASDTLRNRAWLTYGSSTIGYRNTRDFSRYQVFFGNHQQPVTIRLYEDDSLFRAEQYAPGEGLFVMEGDLMTEPKEIKLEFEGVDSPDIYAVNLEGSTGVVVDNIAWRGSSGTIFRKLDLDLLISSFDHMNPGLLLLQFGGNVMPYMKSERECENYGRWFESQLRLLRNLLPEAAIIVIGPSDMGTFEEGEYTSYPLLPKVRDELKAATFRQDGVYWDMMEAMGGAGSMEAWVTANPPLATGDYVHFNLKGAGKIAQMFYNALIQDYNEYRRALN